MARAETTLSMPVVVKLHAVSGSGTRVAFLISHHYCRVMRTWCCESCQISEFLSKGCGEKSPNTSSKSGPEENCRTRARAGASSFLHSLRFGVRDFIDDH